MPVGRARGRLCRLDMSFACRPQSGAFFPYPTIPLGSLYSVSCVATGHISIKFKTNGDLVVSKKADGVTTTLLTTAWYSTPVSDIGLSYWVFATSSGGTDPTSPYGLGFDFWYALSTEKDFIFNESYGGSNTVVDFKIASNSSGTNVVATVSNVEMDVVIL
jgi:hypothetical protein